MRNSLRGATLCAAAALLALASGCSTSPVSRPNPFVRPDPFALGESPFVDQDPRLEGQATVFEEWAGGVRLPDIFYAGPTARAGFYYFESREAWTATSLRSGASATYPGQTRFIAHDLVGSGDPDSILHPFQVDADNDWNSFNIVTPAGNVMIWVFDDQDDPDDSDWLLGAEGLDRSRLVTAAAGNRIDDRGFIARLNDDPTTDVQWMEGMDEPGDPGWNWDDWYGVFGRHSFGSSFQDSGIDPDPENAVPHEVYEVAAYDPAPRDDSVQPDGSPAPPDKDPWCIWWEWVSVDVKVKRRVWVIKDGSPTPATLTTTEELKFPVLRGNFWLHFPPPWFRYETALSLGGLVTAGLDQVIEQTESLAARTALRSAQAAFAAAFDQGLGGGDYDLLFDQLDAAYGHLDAAKAAGVSPRRLADIEVQALSVVATFGAEQVMARDDAGLSIDDPALQELYGALYEFGEVARELSNAERSARGSVDALEPVFRALNRSSLQPVRLDTPPRLGGRQAN